MVSEIKGTWKGMDWRKERWRSWAEGNNRIGFESLQEKVGRLARRVEELKRDKKKGRDSRAMTGSSSENEEGGRKVEVGRRKLVVQSGSPRTGQFEIEAEDFQGGTVPPETLSDFIPPARKIEFESCK